MKLQLDTEKKTIKIESSVKISKLMTLLKQILPDNAWKEYTLEANTTIVGWTSPIVIKEYPRPYYPWWGAPYVYCGTSSTTAVGTGGTLASSSLSLNKGTYNIEA